MRPTFLLHLLPATAAALLVGVQVASTPTEPVAAAGGPPEVIDPEAPRYREFAFTRAVYSDPRARVFAGGRSGNRFRFRAAWATDFPKADLQFLVVLRRLVDLDAFGEEHPMPLDDPELRRFPFLYAVEVGNMDLTDEEAAGLRDYLLAGGFLFADDFWGTAEWRVFERQIRRVLPEHPIVDIPLEHELFSIFYRIDEIVQVPNIGNGRRGGPTWERDGYEPAVRGIFDDDGRLMVLITWNSDLGDAWEWAEDPQYPLRYSTFAFELGANAIVYAMSN